MLVCFSMRVEMYY